VLAAATIEHREKERQRDTGAEKKRDKNETETRERKRDFFTKKNRETQGDRVAERDQRADEHSGMRAWLMTRE
jgi:hypothetical protein